MMRKNPFRGDEATRFDSRINWNQVKHNYDWKMSLEKDAEFMDKQYLMAGGMTFGSVFIITYITTVICGLALVLSILPIVLIGSLF